MKTELEIAELLSEVEGRNLRCDPIYTVYSYEEAVERTLKWVLELVNSSPFTERSK